MIAITRGVGVLFIALVLLCSIESYGKEASGEISTEKVSGKTSTISGDSARSEPSSESKNISKSPSLISYDKLHKVLREERTRFSMDIDTAKDATRFKRLKFISEIVSFLKRIEKVRFKPFALLHTLFFLPLPSSCFSATRTVPLFLYCCLTANNSEFVEPISSA